mgnify:FL=1
MAAGVAIGVADTRPSASACVAAYTWIVGAATVAATAVLVIYGTPSAGVSAAIMIVAVGLIGLPHGAYDLEVARRLYAQRFGALWWPIFGFAYLALAALALGLWVTAPAVGLVLLLVGGAAHWGLDDLEQQSRGAVRGGWLALSRGAIPVAAPMAFHPDAVAEIFAALLSAGSVDAQAVRAWGAVWLAAALPGIVGSLRLGPGGSAAARVRVIAEPIVLLLWFAAAPPIIAFSLYFCMWHAVRHSLRSALNANPGAGLAAALASYAKAAALPTVLTWALAAWAYAAWFGQEGFSRSGWSIVFIGLFALTVPHVTLEWLEHRDAATRR